MDPLDYYKALPFPRSLSQPTTPKPRSDLESPKTFINPQSGDPSSLSKKKGWICLLVLILLFLLYRRFSDYVGQKDKALLSGAVLDDYFVNFEGHQDCSIPSKDIYVPPNVFDKNVQKQKHKLYCSNRAKLLEAMSGGGRHGFERPYFPAGCHYRWYSTTEICMILERFDGVVFVGDEMLKMIYAAFNILLRENIATGALKQWELSDNDSANCHCDNQFVNPKCWSHFVTESAAIDSSDKTSSYGSPYVCNRIPHFYIPISDSPAPDDLHAKFTTLLGNDPNAYKPIPVIHSLGLSTSLSWPSATASMDEWVALADGSGRNVPFLWIAPNAAGHLKPPGQILSQGNNALWHYTIETMKEAKARQLDSVGMYNLTLQAHSWDGSGYGLKVALVQAMMVINWLSRVDST